MRRALGLIVLLAAAGPAFAQPALTPPEDAGRQQEIQVELAWLADPLLCPYYPCARVVAVALEVGGHVPDDSVRLRVLEVARANCTLPLVDRLKVRPGLVVPRLRVPADKLQRAALLLARAEAGGHDEQLQVTCSPSGLVALTGTAGSLEAKLHVSQCLRRLPGCTAVVNLLRVDADRGQPAAPPLPPPVPETKPAPVPEPVLVPPPELPKLPEPPPLPPLPPLPDKAPTVAPIKLISQPPCPLAPPVKLDPEPEAPPVVEDCLVLSPPDAETEPSPIKLVPGQIEARLARRIREACPEVQGVAILFIPPQGVHIRLRVRDQNEGDRLAARVRALPETAFLRVTFAFQADH